MRNLFVDTEIEDAVKKSRVDAAVLAFESQAAQKLEAAEIVRREKEILAAKETKPIVSLNSSKTI